MIKQYPIRIEEQIWRQAKAKAALGGITMKAALERLLLAWIHGEAEVDKNVKGN